MVKHGLKLAVFVGAIGYVSYKVMQNEQAREFVMQSATRAMTSAKQWFSHVEYRYTTNLDDREHVRQYQAQVLEQWQQL